MSFSRCALLWARLPAGRHAGHRAAVCSALRAPGGAFPGARGRVPAVASASSSSSGGSKAPDTSLFVPLTVKPQGPSADGDVGAELTRPLDKSECWSWRGLWVVSAGRPRGSCTPFPRRSRSPRTELASLVVCEPLAAWDWVRLILSYAGPAVVFTILLFSQWFKLSNDGAIHLF